MNSSEFRVQSSEFRFSAFASRVLLTAVLAVALPLGVLNAAQVADLGRDGVGVTVESEPDAVDPARDFFVTVTVKSPSGKKASLPDLRDRFRGFQVAEDVPEEPVAEPDGSTTLVTRWRLVPEPMATRYRLAPFVVTVVSGEEAQTFYTAPVIFENPPAREVVTGDMEIDPKRDLPPLSWKLVGICLGILLAAAGVVCLVWLVVRKIRTMVRIHRMSPIERAMYELEALLKKGLPGRGFFKDFYVELTMVVRRYIERRHSVRAPNLTTEEFLAAAKDNPAFTPEAVAEIHRLSGTRFRKIIRNTTTRTRMITSVAASNPIISTSSCFDHCYDRCFTASSSISRNACSPKVLILKNMA